jgi:sugar phosphate isomerase/epimerase
MMSGLPGDVAIGVAVWCLPEQADAAVARAAALGFSRIHADFGTPGAAGCLESAAAIRALARCLRSHGVALDALAVNCLTDLPLEPERQQETLADRIIRSAVAAAAALEAPVVVIPSFERSAIRSDDDLRRHALRVRLACAEAVSADMLVASETSLGVRGLLRLARLVDDRRFRILLDTQNPVLAGQDPVEIIERLPGLLWTAVHVKDGTAGIMGNAPLGTGDCGLGRTLQAAVRAGFARTWILENEWSEGDAAWEEDRRRLQTLLAGASPESRRYA